MYLDLKIYITKYCVLVPLPQYSFVTWSSAVKEVSSGVNFGQLLGRHFCLSFQVAKIQPAAKIVKYVCRLLNENFARIYSRLQVSPTQDQDRCVYNKACHSRISFTDVVP